MKEKLKGTTLWHLEEVVEQAFDCPHCGHEHEYRTDDIWHEVDEVIECFSCGKEFMLVNEDWISA